MPPHPHCARPQPQIGPGPAQVEGAGSTDQAQAQNYGAAASRSPEPPAVAIVSNHCGWSDILVHMARSFPSFVARADTTQLTMIGLIRCGTLRLQRGAVAAVLALRHTAS